MQLRSDILLSINTRSPYHNTLTGSIVPIVPSSLSHSSKLQRHQHLIFTSKSVQASHFQLQPQLQLQLQLQFQLQLQPPARAFRQAILLTPELSQVAPSSVPTSLSLSLLWPAKPNHAESQVHCQVSQTASNPSRVGTTTTTTTIPEERKRPPQIDQSITFSHSSSHTHHIQHGPSNT